MESLVLALIQGNTPRANQIASRRLGKPFCVRLFIQKSALEHSAFGLTCIAALESLEANGMTEDMAVDIVANLQQLYGVNKDGKGRLKRGRL